MSPAAGIPYHIRSDSELPHCGSHHRTWRAYAKHHLTCAMWISGDGPHAVVSGFPGALTVTLWPTLDQAEQARYHIDTGAGRGAGCMRIHHIVQLTAYKRTPDRRTGQGFDGALMDGYRRRRRAGRVAFQAALRVCLRIS
jgi:hypothetical protein